MKTAVIYARYSCDRQNEQSIDGQLRVCKDYAEKNGIFIIDEYIDKAVTGTNDDRKAFQKMLSDSDKKVWDYVLVYKLDRFSRNKYEMAMHRMHLKENNITILSAMENIPEGPEGILLESLLEGMNQYYSEELSQKTKRGLNETRLKGNFIGGNVNYGYVRDGAKLKINPDEAEVVRKIFSDYANGKRITEIANELNNLGIKNKGNKFLVSTINHLLNHEKYTGIYRINGEVFDKIYPQIIDKEVYEIVLKRKNANRYGKHKDNVNYSLKGKTFCGYCGKPLVSYTGTSCNGDIIRYYKCRSIKEKTNCKNKAIQKEILENIVDKAIKKTFNHNNNLNILVNKILKINEKRNAENTSLNILQANLAKINKSLANIISAIEQGITTESTKARLLELEKEKRETEEKLIIEQSKQVTILTKEQIIKFFKYTLKQCPQNLIELLVNRVDVFKDKIEITFNYTKKTDNNLVNEEFSFFKEKISQKRNYRNKTQHTKTIIFDIVLKI